MKKSDHLRQSLASLTSQAEQAVHQKQAPLKAKIFTLSNIPTEDKSREAAALVKQAATAENYAELLRQAAEMLREAELSETVSGLGKAAADSLRPELEAMARPVSLANALHYSTAALFEQARKAAMMAQTSGPENYTTSSIYRHLQAQHQACRKQAEELGKEAGIDSSQYVADIDVFIESITSLEGVI